MANEIAISHITGATITADVFQPDGTEREFTVSCTEAGQGGLYLGDCATITVNDLIVAYDNGSYIGGEKYQIDIAAALSDIHLDHLIHFAGTVVSGEDTNEFTTDLTETTNNHYDGGTVCFIDGTLAGQVRRISNYIGSSKTIFVDPHFLEVPGNGDHFLITLQTSTVLTEDFGGTAENKVALQCQSAMQDYNLDHLISAAESGDVVANSVIDKMIGTAGACKIASDGLDSVSTTEPAGVASNFREMMIQVWRRFYKKTTATKSAVKSYKDDNSIAATQTATFDGTTKTVGNAS